MNLAEYRAEVKDRLGVPALDTSLSNATLDRAINAALKHIATSADWPWLFTTEAITLAADATEQLLPPNLVKTVYVKEDGARLTLGQGFESEGNRLVFEKTNRARTLIHGYIRHEPLLVLDTDAPLLPDAHSDWLVNEAALRIAIRTNNADRIQQLREEAAVARKAALDNVRRTASLPRIRRTKPSIWPRYW